jgi:type I restriction enzyme S subunit
MSTATTQIKTENQLVPALRFNEFEGDWGKTKLGDIGKVSMCKRIMKDQTSPNGDIPFYKIGTFGKQANAFIDKEIYKEYKTKYSYPQKGDVLIAASGATYGKTVVFDGKPAFFQDSNIVWIDNDETRVSNTFLNINYQFIKWAIQTSTIPRLYNDIIRNSSINNPDLPEQQKIASFLSAVDEKIQQLTKKKELLEQYKKGVMQQLFSGQLRFKDENGNPYPDWEEKRLGEVFKFKQGYQFAVEEQSEEPFDNSVEFVRIINVTSSPEDKRYVVDPGVEFHLNKEDLFMVRYGYAGKIVCGFNGIIANNMFRLLPLIDLSKKWHYFYLDFIYDKIHALAGSSTMPAIKFGTISGLEFMSPCFKEQQKIATYLSRIDTKIEAVNTQITQTQTFKKGLLQQMFV